MKAPCAAAVAVTLAAAVASSVGTAYGTTWEFGVKGGITNAKLTGDPVSAWLYEEDSEGAAELSGAVDDYRLGFIGGAYARADFNGFFGIQAELLYKQKGGEGPVEGTAVVTPPNQVPLESDFEGILTLEADYIEVPVLAVFTLKPGESGRLSLRGLVGPTFSYGVSTEAHLEGQAYNATLPLDDQNFLVDESMDADPYIEDFELGALVGISVSYEVGGMELMLDARWGRGFTTIGNTTTDRSTYNSGIDLMAGFEIPIGSR